MKKYIYILIAVMTAILVSSCSTTKNLTSSDDNTHVVLGVGWSDTSIGDAKAMAHADASDLISKENNSTVQSDVESVTKQKLSGKRMFESREITRTLLIHSGVQFKDSEIEYVELTNKERKKYAITQRFAYKAVVRTDRINVEML